MLVKCISSMYDERVGKVFEVVGKEGFFYKILIDGSE